MNLYRQFLLLTLAGWINRQQQDVVAYLQAENRALREQLGPKRIRWTDAQRRLLADKAKAVCPIPRIPLPIPFHPTPHVDLLGRPSNWDPNPG